MRPGLVLLDEPTANLDPAGRRRGEGCGDCAPRHASRDPRRRRAPGRGVAAGRLARHRARRRRRGRRRAAGRGARARGGRPRCARRLGSRHPSRPSTGTGARGRRHAAVGRAACRGARGRASRGIRDRRSGCAPAPPSRSPGPTARASRHSASRSRGCCPRHPEPSPPPAISAGDAGPSPIRWRSRQLLTRIGTVFQDPEHQLLAKTVREELEVGPRALGLADAEIAERVDELLERLRLAPLASREPLHAVGGREAPADGRRRARDRAARARARRADVRAGCPHVGRARRAPRGTARRGLGDRRDHARPRCGRGAARRAVRAAGGWTVTVPVPVEGHPERER